MFGVPGTTEFDVRFRLLGIPVRVHPFFWVLAAFLGWELTRGGGKLLLLWIACVFFSILVHEYGHALVVNVRGRSVGAALLHGGGSASIRILRELLWQRFFVLAMGPGARVPLMGAAIAWGSLQFHASPIDIWNGEVIPGAPYYAWWTIYFLVTINFFWGVLNLLPVMPLDGALALGSTSATASQFVPKLPTLSLRLPASDRRWSR